MSEIEMKASGNGRHILAINDDEAILRLFQDLLTLEGYRVSLDTFSNTTSELLDTVREMQPDLVILDFIIGGEGKGWQMLQAMKMDRATRHIPVIVCTAAVTVLAELGAHLVTMQVRSILKPFDIDDLLNLVLDVWKQIETTPSVEAVTAFGEVESRGSAG